MRRIRLFYGFVFLLGTATLQAQTHAELEGRMVELFNAGKFEAAIPVAIKAKDAAKKEYGDTSNLFILGISNLAFLYEKTGNYPPTESLYEELAAIYKKKFGEAHPSYAVALNSHANAFYASGKLKQALPLYSKALAIQKKVYGNMHPEYWIIAKNLANTCYDLKDFKNAAIHFFECMAIAKKLKGEKSAEYLEALESAAVVSSDINDYTKAKTLYGELAALLKEKGGTESAGYATIINVLGRMHLDEADLPKAEQLFREAMEIRKRVLGTAHAEYGQSLNNLGALYRKKGDYKQARRYYEEALAIRKSNGGETSRDFGQTLNNLAELAQAEGNYALAEVQMKKAVAIRKNADGEDNAFYALNLNNLATLYSEMEKNEESEVLHRQVLEIRKKLFGEIHPDYAQTLNNLAVACANQGKNAEAEQYYTQALAIRKKIWGEQHPDYAQTLSNLGLLFSATGRYKDAETALKQAAEIRKMVLGAEHPDHLLIMDNLASLYININAFENAEALLKLAVAGRKKVLGEEHKDYGVSLNNLGALYCLTGRNQEGLALYQQVTAIYKKALGEQHPGYALALHNTAEIYSRLKNYKAAEPLFEQAIGIYKTSLGAGHPDMATPLLGLATLYSSMGNYSKAEQLLDSSNKIILRHMQQNFINLGEEEKMQWWEEEANRYQMAPSLLVTNPKHSAGFLKQTLTQQVQVKGFILKDGRKILEQVRKQGSPELKLLLSDWQSNKVTLARQYSLPVNQRITRLDSIEKRTIELEKQLNQQSSLFRSGNDNNELNVETIRKALKPGEAAIEFIRFGYFNKGWTDSVLYAAFVLLPGAADPKFVLLCEERKLSALLDAKSSSSEAFVKQLYRGTELRNKTQQAARADSLYNLVWKPLQPFLVGINRVHIAPAGLLNRVAFHALAIDSVRYLIDEYALRQLSTIGQITAPATSVLKKEGDAIVLYGGIDFDVSGTAENKNKTAASLPEAVQRSIRGGRWNSLPGTLEEVRSIQQLYAAGKKKVVVLKDKTATEESLKELSGRSPAILHLATHGFSLPDVSKNRDKPGFGNQFSAAANPLLRSGVIMAGANRVWNGGTPLAGQEDGIATAYEIAGLDLSGTELVVLSACETALGDIRGTEGVFGLQRAFKLAGVQQMILSLWQVPDKETAELMNLFYSEKLKGKSSSEAFLSAQQAMRKKYPVYYWAAFTLIE